MNIAILIPCYNEAGAIRQVVHDFKQALPNATIYVYDNMSTDNTFEIALESGAVVKQVSSRGKGNVVRRMFADIDADIYILVDGDDTYDALQANELIKTLYNQQLDMVIATRMHTDHLAYRAGHVWGNRALTGMVSKLFGREQICNDMLSGYRAFSRRYVKSFPAFSRGFEIETELTIHALELTMPIGEIATHYKARPVETTSKLRTYRDGWQIMMTILRLFRLARPLIFYSTFTVLFSLTSIGLAIPIIIEFLHTGLVPRFPTAILSTGLALMAALSLTCGLILEHVTYGRQEMKRLFYLAQPVPPKEGN
jgi:glycosyltransferase involved in cell wall biosynthesis